MTGGPADSCEMCREVRRNTVGASGLDDPSPPRLVMRWSGLDVMAGLGSLTPGYALVVPHRHAPSSGDLPAGERSRLHVLARAVAAQIERVFACRVTLVEHGSSGKEAGHRGGGCITHCHIHLFPLPPEADARALVPPGAHPVDGLGPLIKAADARRNYYYCSWAPSFHYLTLEPPAVSQYARRVWAEIVGLPDTWDWAAFPYIENCHITIRELRRDEARMNETIGAEVLDETLATYENNAARYAADTEQFADDSALPHQIDHLLNATTGPVLDAGAGAGRDAHYMAARGRPVVAMDASASLLTQVKWSAPFSRLVADIRDIPLADCSVGAIWCSAVLLHLGGADVRRSLDELHRVLRPGGIMQISVKEGRGLVSEQLGESGEVRHFFLYELPELRALVEEAGFEVTRAWTEEESNSGRSAQSWVKVLATRRY
ncbi:methyltransferase domain-containing protein [Micromonospora chalcea]|uniref:methyltransferase domain-containing protein n=1 Tax=Micromonospora chalcea TaxID=1874 RepID=UPI0033174989